MNNMPNKRIEVEALIVGYAMSRLDNLFLDTLGYQTWVDAFDSTSSLFSMPPASIKNIRDEFDPFHDNGRMGWHKRPLRQNRLRVLTELCDLSN